MGTMVPISAFRPAGIVMAEYWAGMLVALALAFYHFRWWTAAACCGVVAIFVRELAVPFGVICGLFALSERRHREGAVWVVGGLAYVAYYLLHAQAVSAAMLPTDWSWPHSWARFLGWPFVLQTAWVAGWTLFLPYAVTPIMAVLALAGAFARSMPRQLRWPLVAYALLFCVVGQPFNFYWGFVTAPVWTYALLYSPEGAKFLVSRGRTAETANATGDRVPDRTSRVSIRHTSKSPELCAPAGKPRIRVCHIGTSDDLAAFKADKITKDS